MPIVSEDPVAISSCYIHSIIPLGVDIKPLGVATRIQHNRTQLLLIRGLRDVKVERLRVETFGKRFPLDSALLVSVNNRGLHNTNVIPGAAAAWRGPMNRPLACAVGLFSRCSKYESVFRC